MNVLTSQVKKIPENLSEVKGKGLAYVSRGGLKLEKALKVFDLSIDEIKLLFRLGRASTGGLLTLHCIA